MSDARSATGILVRRSPYPAADPPVFTTVAEITEVTPGGKSRNKIDTSNHNEGVESGVPGMLRQGDPGFKVNVVGGNATHILVNEDIDNNVKALWQILYPSGISRTGPGYVGSFVYDGVPMDGKQAATIGLMWAGIVDDDIDPA